MLLPVVFGKATLLKLAFTFVVLEALAHDASFTYGI